MNESELDQILWEEQLEHENYLLSLGSAYLCSSCHAGVTAEGISQESH
jgi:hypothetical protein